MNRPGFRRGAVICRAEVVGRSLEDSDEDEEEEEKGKEEVEAEEEAIGGVVEG